MNECDYYRELEEEYDYEIKYPDEDIIEQWMEEYSDETLDEIYENLELWDEDKHLYDYSRGI